MRHLFMWLVALLVGLSLCAVSVAGPRAILWGKKVTLAPAPPLPPCSPVNGLDYRKACDAVYITGIFQ